MHYNAGSSTNAYSVIDIQSSYITLDSIIIENTATSGYNHTIRVYTASHYFDATNSTFKVRTGGYNGGYAYNVHTGDGSSSPSGNTNAPNNCTFDNCIIDGGYQGLALYGGASSLGPWPQNNEVINCTFQNYYYYGLYSYYQDDIKIVNNHMDGTNAYAYNYGLYLGYSNDVTATNNVVDGAGGYGIYIYRLNYYNTGSVTGRSLVANNSVHGNWVGTSSAYGMYVYYCRSTDVVYNSVNMTGNNSTHYGMNVRYNDNTVMVKNNVIKMTTAGGYADYSYNNTGMSASNYNYNTFYNENNSSMTYYWDFTTYSGLSAFQTGSSTNANSQEADPTFNSLTDNHINGSNLYGKGTPITGVTVDIDGTTRSVTTPSPGIHEFIPPQNDVGIVSFTQPVAQCAGTNEIEVVVKITDFSFNQL